MSFTNTPIMTPITVLSAAAALVGNVTPTDLSTALSSVLLSHGDRLKNRFYITFEIPNGACEINVGAYGIDDIERVEKACGLSCWSTIQYHREQDNRIIFDGWDGEARVRITYWEAPTMETTSTTLASPYTVGDASMHIVTAGISPILRLPTSGIVLVSHVGGQPRWMEYRGYTIREANAGIDLLGVQQMPNLEVLTSPATIPVGQVVEWGIGFPSSLALDAVCKQIAAYYWATKTGQCTNEDERSTALSVMNLWLGEAEKAWRMVRSPRKGRINQQRQPGDRGTYSWPYLY